MKETPSTGSQGARCSHLRTRLAAICLLTSLGLFACNTPEDDREHGVGTVSSALDAVPGRNFGWTALGSGFVGAPAVCVLAPGYVIVAIRGADNKVYTRMLYAGTWGDWTSLGGVALSDPACTSMNPWRADVFVLSTGNSLQQATWTLLGAWTSWKQVPGPVGFSTGPSAGSGNTSTELVLAATGGNDKQIYLRSFDVYNGWGDWSPMNLFTFDEASIYFNGSWNGYEIWLQSRRGFLQSLHSGEWPEFGMITSAPSAYKFRDGVPHIAFRGMNGDYQDMFMVNTGYRTCNASHGWGGKFASKPALVNYQLDSKDTYGIELIFGTDANGRLLYAGGDYWHPDATWYSQHCPAPPPPPPPPPVIDSFTVSPHQSNNVNLSYVSSGSASTISWSVTPPLNCGQLTVAVTGIDPGNNAVKLKSISASAKGSVSYVPTNGWTNMTLRVACGATGAVASAPNTIVVQLAPQNTPPPCTNRCFKISSAVTCYSELWCVPNSDPTNGMSTEMQVNPGATVSSIDCADLINACP